MRSDNPSLTTQRMTQQRRNARGLGGSYGTNTNADSNRSLDRQRFGVGSLIGAAAGNLASSFGMAPEGPVTPWGMRSMMRGNEERFRYQSPEHNEAMAQSPGVGGSYGKLISTARRNAARNPR